MRWCVIPVVSLVAMAAATLTQGQVARCRFGVMS